MPLIKKKKNKKVRSLPKVGLNSVPFTSGFDATLYYFHIDVDRKEVMSVLKTYIKNNYTKVQTEQIFTNPDWKFQTYSHHGCTAYWINTKQDIHCKKFTQETIDGFVDGLKKYCDKLLEEGKPLLKEKKLKSLEQKNVIVLSPQQRLQKKMDTNM